MIEALKSKLGEIGLVNGFPLEIIPLGARRTIGPFDVELVSGREDAEQVLDFESRAGLAQDVLVGAPRTLQLCERHTRRRVMEPGGETARVSGDDFERPTHRLWPCAPACQVTVRTSQGSGDVRASG